MVEEVEKVLDRREEVIEQPILDESILERFALRWDEAYYHWENDNGHPATDYMFERGFDPLSLDEWEFGYDEISDRVTFAVRDEHGRLVGFKARAHDGRHPKYLVLGDGGKEGRYGFPRYYPSRVVYGAHRVQADSEVVICEGELNAVVISGWTGIPSVAINGSYFSESHARIIRGIASKAILFLDDDSAGENAMWGWTDTKGRFHPGIVTELSPHLRIEIVPAHDRDAAQMQQDGDGEALLGLIKASETLLLRALKEKALPRQKTC